MCKIFGHKWDKTWRYTKVDYLECLRCGYKFKLPLLKDDNES